MMKIAIAIGVAAALIIGKSFLDEFGAFAQDINPYAPDEGERSE